ncbi:unnamed protein product, partial [Brassica napus]
PKVLNATPGQAGSPAEFKHINKRRKKETNKDSLIWRSVLSDGPGPSSLERGAREGESPSCPDPVAPRGAVYESGCLGMQPQSGR